MLGWYHGRAVEESHWKIFFKQAVVSNSIKIISIYFDLTLWCTMYLIIYFSSFPFLKWQTCFIFQLVVWVACLISYTMAQIVTACSSQINTGADILLTGLQQNIENNYKILGTKALHISDIIPYIIHSEILFFLHILHTVYWILHQMFWSFISTFTQHSLETVTLITLSWSRLHVNDWEYPVKLHDVTYIHCKYKSAKAEIGGIRQYLLH